LKYLYLEQFVHAEIYLLVFYSFKSIIIMCISGTADRLLHMLTEERDENVLIAVTASLQTLSKTHSKQIVQNMIHYKLQNSVTII